MIQLKLKSCWFLFSFLLLINVVIAQPRLDKLLPVRAFCISAPKPQNLERFIKFINEELQLNKINTLILRVDYNYQFTSHPELRDTIALSKENIQQLLVACKQNNIKLIPQINMLGHQSWAGRVDNLLKIYPQFDETPQVIMPLIYTWPNADSLYCKSYCPLHPDLHKVIFELIDEICTVFESDVFHAGMDEVFYIGDAKCPRCTGKVKAVLFAGEVNTIRDHLAKQKRKLWIWGDRLIDGRATKVGEWEGSYNNTQDAVNLIKKDVVICDWHYEKAEQIPTYFAGKGLSVITCTWRTPAVAVTQTKDMVRFRQTAKPAGKKVYYKGMMQTIWTNSENFLDEYYALKNNTAPNDSTTKENTAANCFKAMTREIIKLSDGIK